MVAPSVPRRRWVRGAALCGFLGALAATRSWTRNSDSLHVAEGAAFVAGAGPPALRGLAQRGAGVALQAYGPILRRDPTLMNNLDRWVFSQQRAWRRARGLPEDDKEQKKKNEYLMRLGLASKIVDKSTIPAWHLEHIKPGDVFEGFLQHPDLELGDRLDFSLTVKSPTVGLLYSEKAAIDDEVDLRQDFPIAFEKGSKERARSMAAYIFSKFNMRWRDFSEPVPSEEELEHIKIEGLQLFFSQAAKVDNFPDQDTFNSACADPGKGMSLDEFLEFTVGEDPEYLEKSWDEVYTGRRIQFNDGTDLEFDADFAPDAMIIAGFMTLKGKGGGSFELELQPEGKEE